MCMNMDILHNNNVGVGLRRLALLYMLALTAVLSLMAAEPYGVVSIPVSCMRTAPGHANEQSSQAVLGTPVRILSQTGDWYSVETPDGYTGYMRSNTLRPLSEGQFRRWKTGPRVVCRAWLARLYDEEMRPAGYAPFGSVLTRTDAAAPQGYYGILSPNGKPGLVDAADVWPDTDSWLESFRGATADSVIALAGTMLGAPYLWGGTSSLAPDCSAFVQMAFASAGLLLPRDTSQQILCGQEVTGVDEAVPGDLIFFGNSKGRVNHVAIYIGHGHIIHSSGNVHKARLSDETPGDEPVYDGRLIAVRRILGTGGTPAGVRRIAGSLYF